MLLALLRPHRLSRIEALDRSRELVEAAAGLFPLRWTESQDGVAFTFHGMMRGRLTVSDKNVQAAIQLPFIFGWLRPLLASRLSEELDMYLYPLEPSTAETAA